MNPPGVDVMQLLADNGLGTIGASLFYGEWNSDNDKQTLVLDSEAPGAELKTQVEQPFVQILSRGGRNADMLEVYAVARAVYEFLIQQPENVSTNGVCYKGFEPMSSPYGIGRDENGRMVYSMNFYTYRNPV